MPISSYSFLCCVQVTCAKQSHLKCGSDSNMLPAPGYKVCSRHSCVFTLRNTWAFSHPELPVNSSTQHFLPSPFTYSPAGAAWASHTHSFTHIPDTGIMYTWPSYSQSKFTNKIEFINKIGKTVLIRHMEGQTSRSITYDKFFLSSSTCIFSKFFLPQSSRSLSSFNFLP